MRKPFVAGNWKMNTSRATAVALAKAVAGECAGVPAVDVAVCPPFPYLQAVAEALAGGAVALGGQNAYFEKEGAFTGEVSPLMLKDIGCRYVICVGETLREREEGMTDFIVKRQLSAVIHLNGHCSSEIVVAYEPVWAIGTGEVCASDEADRVCGVIRATVARLYDQATAEAVRIQYGGSVKPDNAKELLSKPNIDGALVGGASLKAADFLGIIEAV